VKQEVSLCEKELSALSGQRSLNLIKKSLTQKSRKVFIELALLQLDKMKSFGKSKKQNPIDIEFRVLARICREKYIAHSDTILRSLLQEFLDHAIIKYSAAGNNYLCISSMNMEEMEKAIESMEADEELD